MKAPANSAKSILSSFGILGGVAGIGVVAGNVSIGVWSLADPLMIAGLLISAGALVAGVRGMARVNREMHAWIDGDHPSVRAELAERMGKVLAHWTYAPDEWQAYVRAEHRHGSGEAWGMGVVVGLLCGAIAYARGVPAWGAVPAGAAAGAVYVAGIRHTAARTRRESAAQAAPSVTIATNAVLFHGRRRFLADGQMRIARVRYVGGEWPTVQIATAAPGSLGSYDIRIPVPRGREDEARALVESFPGVQRAIEPAA